MTPPTTIRLSDDEAQLLRDARDRLIRQGVGKLDPLELSCPKCGVSLPSVSVKSPEWTCPACGHRQAGLKLGVGGTLALGSVAGAGMVALLWWLNHQEGSTSP